MAKKIIPLFFISMLMIFLSPVSVHAALPSGIQKDDLEDAVDEFTEEHEEYSAGVMFSVFTPDEVLYQANGGMQNIDDEVDVSEASVFEWGSITKLLTWISMMQLAEDNRVNLDDEVTEYLPDDFLREFEQQSPTILDLMNHQGGFDDNIPELFVREAPDDDSLENAVRTNQPVQIYEPGEVTAYSNWGAALAGYIVETVSDQPFDEYVHEHILTPLDMKQTALSPDLSDNPAVRDARSESAGYFRFFPSESDEDMWYMPLYPAGSAVSTLADLVTFARALFPSNEETPLFENPDTLVSMFEVTEYHGDTEIPRNAHGFHVTLFENAVYGHMGNTNAFSSNLMLDIESDIGYVVMINESQETTYTTLFPEVIFGDYMDTEDFEDYEAVDLSRFYTPLSGYITGAASYNND